MAYTGYCDVAFALYLMDPQAVPELEARGLLRATRWAAEALCGMKHVPRLAEPIAMTPQLRLAKSYFDTHEFDRCRHALRNEEGNLAKFLSCYAYYLSGEAAKSAGELEPGHENPHLPILRTELDRESDPFLLYLYGVVLRRQKSLDRAIEALSQSVLAFPYNWSAWLELLACPATIADIRALATDLESLGANQVMVKLFRLQGNQECYEPQSASDDLIRELRRALPNFAHIDVQEAAILVHNIEYEAAAELYERVIQRDPYRLDGMDVYSNMLYITEQSAKLSRLAYTVAKSDKFSAEACCIIANYCGLQGDHEQAVQYYRRALIGNREYLAAWTLLGHEYVELRDVKKAIECYQMAVDINKRDFRAWYGLGQANEFEENLAYARYFYQKALFLRPNDVRMWAALANCAEKSKEPARALSLYEQALQIGGSDAYLCYKIAKLYEILGMPLEAHRYMELCLQSDDEESEWAGRAHLWLSNLALAKGDYNAALRHATAAEGTAEVLEFARVAAREATARGGRAER